MPFIMDESGIKRTFGDTVRRRRRAIGVSQEELAELSDLHRTYISDIERGERNVSLLNMVRLAAALKTDPASLLSELRGIKLKHRKTIR